MTRKKSLYKFDPFNTKDDGFMTANSVGPIVTPLFPQIEVKYDKLEIKASGYKIEGINEIIKTIYSNCGVPQTVLEDNESNIKSAAIDNQKETSKGRIAEVNNPDREKPLDIDVDLLKDKIRLPRLAEGFRCPNCGQAFITKAVTPNNTQSMFIFRNVNSNTEESKVAFRKVSIEGIVIKDRADKEELISLYKELDKFTFEVVNLLYQEGTDCHCPLCGDKEHALMDWVDAWVSPLNYFDVEMICDICGDDAKLVMTGDTEYIECSNNCLSNTAKKKMRSKENSHNNHDCEEKCRDSRLSSESYDDCCEKKV